MTRHVVVLKFPEDPNILDCLFLLKRIRKELKDMAQELDDLTAQVAETKTVMQSAVVLIQGLRQAIIDAGTDPAKLKELTDGLKVDEDALADAVANVPA